MSNFLKRRRNEIRGAQALARKMSAREGKNYILFGTHVGVFATPEEDGLPENAWLISTYTSRGQTIWPEEDK